MEKMTYKNYKSFKEKNIIICFIRFFSVSVLVSRNTLAKKAYINSGVLLDTRATDINKLK